MQRRHFLAQSATALTGTIYPLLAQAEKRYDPGASDTEIRIGQTMPYSGPLSAYATIGRVEAAYFKKINDEGGVNGRKINFISLDDAYNPSKTVEAVHRLVESDEVLLIFGSLGTPTNLAVAKYLGDRNVPLLFLSTGGSMWADPHKYPWAMGWSPTYYNEGRIFATHILQTRPTAKIAILSQNDDTGRDYVNGFKEGLGDKRQLIVAEASYEVSEPTIDSQILQLRAAGADVLFDQTTPKFAAQVIRKLADIGWKPVHYLNGISASIGSVLVPAGLDNAVGVISTIYQKDVTDPGMAADPAVQTWLAFMRKYYPSGNLLDGSNAAGYLLAQTIVQVLKQCGDDLSHENVMRQAANLKDLELDLLMSGVKINTSATNYAPIKGVRLRRFDGKKWVVFGDILGQ